MDKIQASSAKYRVRRVGLGSLSKFSCILGALICLLPSLAVGLGGLLVLHGGRGLLESWQLVEMRLLGQSIPIDVVTLLHLEETLERVRLLDSLAWLLLVLFVAGACGLGGLLFLAVGDLAGWVYNLVAALSGGLEVELREGGGRRQTPPARQ
jgi:hypothetical protein